MEEILARIKKVLDENETIGIFLSGGFDSAVMAYLLHKFKNPNNKFEFYSVPRYDNSFEHARRILKYLDREFNYPRRNPIMVGYPEIHHSLQVRSGLHHALELGSSNILVLGCTGLPDDETLATDFFAPEREESTYPLIYQPFIKSTKKDIVQLAIDLGLTEIMEISHSCTESISLRCSTCWQCRERAWAFKQCGYTDPGTM